MKWFRGGPGWLVTAAFVGPGTVTTATVAGVKFGPRLAWVVVFATLAAMVLQEMSARLGLAMRRDLAEALRASSQRRGVRALLVSLVVAAIFFGNSAFQAGNLTGAAWGLELICGVDRRLLATLIAAAAGWLLWAGRYQTLQGLLTAVVLIMSGEFLVTAIAALADPAAAAQGLLFPSLPEGSLLTVIALIGTTVVPYNLFLHSRAVQLQWGPAVPVEDAVRSARNDILRSVSVGGLITLAILLVGATAVPDAEIASAAAMARQLEGVLGARGGQWLFAAGLFAAGMTSAVTAPLAAAYATCGALAWPQESGSKGFRAVWLIVLLTGWLVACLGGAPTQVIVIAQVCNGLLLPLIAAFLLYAVNQSTWMGSLANSWRTNLLAGAVVLLAAFLGLYSVATKLSTIATF